MNLKKDSKKITQKGIEAANPITCVRQEVNVHDDILRIKGNEFSLMDYQKIYVGGIGKAAGNTATALEEIIKPTKGIIITKGNKTAEPANLQVTYGSHPIPTKENKTASRKLLKLSKQAGRNDLFIFLISGGGSALFCLPAGKLTVSDIQTTTNLLLESGANIQEINAVRKHLSKVKGGQLVKTVKPATLTSLILSDVVGNELGTIASGPTTVDQTTFATAVKVLKKYHLWSDIPKRVKDYLRKGNKGRAEETLKEKVPNVHNYIIGNNLTALLGAQKEAQLLDYNTKVLSSSIEGEAKTVGAVHAGIAKEIQNTGNPISPPAVILSGGETTVKIENSRGKGGPNHEFVLGAASKIRDKKNIGISAVDTDGIDGNSDNSGAFATGDTITGLKKPLAYYFSNHRTGECFNQLGDSIQLGETGTNVNDLRILLVK